MRRARSPFCRATIPVTVARRNYAAPGPVALQPDRSRNARSFAFARIPGIIEGRRRCRASGLVAQRLEQGTHNTKTAIFAVLRSFAFKA
jgi:hypothetical protein